MRARPCESCGAPVIDLVHERTRKPAPINALPVPHGGNVFVDLDSGTYRLITKAERAARVFRTAEDGKIEQLYLSHFLTCPDAARWRRR